MGWAIVLLLALLVGAALWRFARPGGAGLQLIGAALLLAFAGYAWQGHPTLAGSPKRPPQHQDLAPSAFSEMRRDLLGRFNTSDQWLTIADSYLRRGDTEGAAQVIAAAIRAHPNDATLWVGYGNTLVLHGGGLMSPAAQLAFQRAQQLAPDHPAPRFFYGLSLAQGGRLDEAEVVWRQLLATAPPDAKWRAQVQQQLDLIERARAIARIQQGQPQP